LHRELDGIHSARKGEPAWPPLVIFPTQNSLMSWTTRFLPAFPLVFIERVWRSGYLPPA
jgi:hypothetical protein